MTLRDEKSLHKEIDTKVKKRTKWKRRNFGKSTTDGTRIDAENEIDRDMMKDLEQIACDIHETYFRLNRNCFKGYNFSKNPDMGILKNSMDLLLFSLARTASMNAKVAKGTARLNRGIFVLTLVMAILTLVLTYDAIFNI